MFSVATAMEPPQYDKPAFEGEVEHSPAVISLCASPYPDIRRVRCYVRDGIALLEGRVPTYHQKQLAQEMVRRAPGIKTIHNHVVVEGRR